MTTTETDTTAKAALRRAIPAAIQRNGTGESREWFTVDREGLAKILQRKGPEFAIFELVQNAWDEAGVTKVTVELESISHTRARLLVEDDAPDGFKDLTHAFTLFAESAKKSSATQRGRFNLGEKLVLAIMDEASVLSTTGGVIFDKNGRHMTDSRTGSGSVFSGTIRMTKAQVRQVTEEVKKLLPPTEIKTVFNGTEILPRAPIHTLNASLPTEISDEKGDLRRSIRVAEIQCHAVQDGETALIYEMGIPVCEHDCAYHTDIMQKVPLSLDRDTVKPELLKKLRAAVFNATHASLTPEAVTHEWAQTAIESPDAEPEAVVDYMTKRFGEKRVSYDMNDPEANNKAIAEGFTLVKGGMLSGAAWKQVKTHAAIVPAGKLFPTKPEGDKPYDPAEWTDGMRAVADYAKKFASVVIGVDIKVEIGKQKSSELANYGGRRLQFNATNLGPSWFNMEKNRVAIDDLIIHELGHEYASNHLSTDYYNALSRIGAKAMAATREGRLD